MRINIIVLLNGINIYSVASSEIDRLYIQFISGNSYFEIGDYDNALNIYDGILFSTQNQQFLNSVYYMKAFSFLYNAKFESSKSNFQLINEQDINLYSQASEYISYINNFSNTNTISI